MKGKETMKKCIWIVLVVLLSFLMVQTGRNVTKNIWFEGGPTIHYYAALFQEILRGIAAIVPVWFLSVVGLARSFLGENWFPFAERIPVWMTKAVLAVSVILLIGVAVADATYSGNSFQVRHRMESIFEQLQTVSAWVLFYSILLYVEQWCLQRSCSRQDIRKKQIWVAVTFFLTWLIQGLISCIALWYIPLSRVGCPNDLEDYFLWWFSLFSAVFILTFLFFSARKTVRLFKKQDQWMALSTKVPKKITVLTVLVSIGFMIRQIQESRYWRAWAENADLPEYGEASAMGHTFQAMLWGMLLFYAICLLIKQLWAARRARMGSRAI